MRPWNTSTTCLRDTDMKDVDQIVAAKEGRLARRFSGKRWSTVWVRALRVGRAVSRAAIPVVCMLFGAWISETPGAERYVATDGNDTHPGTKAQPWRTLRKAAAAAGAGDVVFVKDGTYFERVVFQKSGTAQRKIVFKPVPGHVPVLSGKKAAQWDGLLHFGGVDHIRFEGFTVTDCKKGQAIYIIHKGEDPATHLEMVNLKIHKVADSPVQVRGNSHHILVRGCTIHDCGASGIDASHFKGGRPHHISITGNTIHKSRFAGIGSEVADDLVVDGNTVYGCRIGIDIGSGRNNVISGNTIRDCNDGIALSSNSGSHVRDNVVHDVKEAMYAYFWIKNKQPHANNKWYRNVVYNATWGLWEMNRKSKRHGTGPTAGHEYYNNLFYNIGGNPTYRSPFWFRGVSGFKFHNNTLHLKPGHNAIELAAGSKGAVFQNNIVWVGGKAKVYKIGEGSTASIDHNCYWRAGGSAEKKGAHDIVRDPGFVNAAKGDFSLRGDSPCIDAGQSLGGFKDDLKKRARPRGAGWDMGCLEREK